MFDKVELIFLELQYLIHFLMYVEYCLCVLVLHEVWRSTSVDSEKLLVLEFFRRQKLSGGRFSAVRTPISRDMSVLVLFLCWITRESQRILVNQENQSSVGQYGTTISPSTFSSQFFSKPFQSCGRVEKHKIWHLPKITERVNLLLYQDQVSKKVCG